ncbi:cation diffusion facilitator CzcD-associated flavoprotein CzcO [Novosphingobium sp. PhB165]|uniref:flavin-containing monooxygenase n=1 Tax=Novosphingobium sp. PhB165 TaxID=2485105 RepID=UPI00104E0ACB|nr:NAD(P)/FAD-dependent oxidoreductase [Novosphingobium sp. PhB165]TCM14676.1 cation diffusion facilitator CzcD-associated flavoprotein CzcO [Novosphingobium sp. PhB165]
MAQDKQTTRKLRYAIVGAGMAGLLAGVKLRQNGEEFTLFEKADKLGGTWRENRYPGLTCDVPAHAYTYAFEPYPEWKAYYAAGPEIQAYFEMVADKYDVRRSIRFGCEVAGLVWDEAAAEWTVTLANGESHRFDVVIAASGVLHHPKTPPIEGLESFAGHAFHTARWDDDAPIDGARVGLIGCGSTGVQILTAINKRVERLVHFQRSPQWIMPVPQFPYSDEDRAAFRADPALMDAIRYHEDYIGAIRRFTDGITDIDGPEMAEIEEICRVNLENSIRDPQLREKLRPDYRAACKRLIYSWCFYEEVQNPSVFVETGRIARVEPEGVRMQDGTFHPLDTLILATGFHADRFIRPATVTGEGGRSLDEAWAKRPTAYYALSVPHFPNLFLLNGPTGPVGNFSLIDIAERQWDYVEQLLDRLRTGEVRQIAPTAAAHADYEERRIDAAKKTIFGSGCTSWYLDAEGVPASWPWSYDAFADAMRTPIFADYGLSDASSVQADAARSGQLEEEAPA